MKLSVWLGAGLRTRVDELAAAWGMTVSQAVRRLVIRGLGGDETDVAMANEEAAGRRTQMQARLELDYPGIAVGFPIGGPRGAASKGSRPKAIVRVAFPSTWRVKIRHGGGLKACIGRGLVVLGEADNLASLMARRRSPPRRLPNA